MRSYSAAIMAVFMIVMALVVSNGSGVKAQVLSERIQTIADLTQKLASENLDLNLEQQLQKLTEMTQEFAQIEGGKLDVCSIVQQEGYPCETHYVTTPDGYILAVHRIPHGKSQKPTAGRPVAYLQHGFLDSSFTWVFNLPHQSLGYLLADSGYDVWMGNSRGNVYGQNHTSLSIKDSRFWKFSWDEFVKYDLPAKIKYIIKATSVTKMVYVGHSEGTAQAFANFADPASDIARYIQPFVALAPVARVAHISVPLLKIVTVLPDVMFTTVFGKQSFLNDSTVMQKVTPLVCKYFPTNCASAICVIAGCENKANINGTRLPMLLARFPAGTSVNNALHYRQGIQSKQFQKFDFGAKGNEEHYGQRTPPQYAIASLKPPTFLYHGSVDSLADPEDVKWIINNIPTPVVNQKFDDYGHGDFVWGIDTAERIYKPLIQKLKQFYL